ncbi:hypothetical protein QBC37DRAFT_15177 [Rhypophila decipiens]|uniref:Large ribosomal subunit protein mL40 n=1 Tax=Rhypophila decipiens TaxID=261697 RepID=A0AAN6Y258_9PEZI|nr:hypothetical protein QBC37DRAFT_15177 [Rhypophila decipiens]
MASLSLNLRGLASRLIPSGPLLQPITSKCIAAFSTTPTHPAPVDPKAAAAKAKLKASKAAAKAKKSKRKGAEEKDPKIIQMMRHFAAHNPKNIPPPLRMARNRYLRHWTIHRGWLMFRRKQREERERTLMRQYQSMSTACEELRLTNGPGTRDTGYLYRVAMEKKGVYGHKGIPIEYARAQTDTPAKIAWNHEWKR